MAIVAGCSLLLVVAACGDDPSAQYFPTGRPAHASQSIDSTLGSESSNTVINAQFIHGEIDRPDPKLTPGVVAVTDLSVVCSTGKRVHGEFMLRNPLIPLRIQQQVLAEYNIPQTRALHYGLDFLVPLQLGGANSIENIWPVSTTHGLGFREKEILNIRLHVLACQRQLPLEQAQLAVRTDWVKLWLKVG